MTQRKKTKEDGFYKTYAWRVTRAQVIDRDHKECQHCAAQGGFHKAECVHHIVPLEDAPELALDMSNLVALCRDCHERVHGREKKEPAIEEWW